jgi:hypothetical protein
VALKWILMYMHVLEVVHFCIFYVSWLGVLYLINIPKKLLCKGKYKILEYMLVYLRNKKKLNVLESAKWYANMFSCVDSFYSYLFLKYVFHILMFSMRYRVVPYIYGTPSSKWYIQLSRINFLYTIMYYFW